MLSNRILKKFKKLWFQRTQDQTEIITDEPRGSISIPFDIRASYGGPAQWNLDANSLNTGLNEGPKLAATVTECISPNTDNWQNSAMRKQASKLCENLNLKSWRLLTFQTFLITSANHVDVNSDSLRFEYT